MKRNNNEIKNFTQSEYHTTLGALVSLFFVGAFVFFTYTFGTHKEQKKLSEELAVEKARILDLTEVIVEQQEEIEELKEQYELLSNPEPIDYKPVDVFCLAKNIYHEAGIESEYGKIAVAQVTINRVRTGRWGKTICDVVMARHQFSWANKRSIRWERPTGPLWKKSYEIAHRILKRGLELKNFEHALYYHADYVKPKWASSKYYIEKIGTHIFYYKTL